MENEYSTIFGKHVRSLKIFSNIQETTDMEYGDGGCNGRVALPEEYFTVSTRLVLFPDISLCKMDPTGFEGSRHRKYARHEWLHE